MAATGWRAPQGRPTTTLLLRHGQTPLSAERRFAGRGDIPLTDLGSEQAAAAAAAIAERGGIDLVLSSPLRRAQQTALAVAQRTGAPLATDDDLAETDFGTSPTYFEGWVSRCRTRLLKFVIDHSLSHSATGGAPQMAST